MSKTVQQIYATNPTTVVADTDLYYLVQSPYTPGTDAAISGLSLKTAFGGGGTINPGLANQLAYYAGAGSTISGLTSGNNGVLVTSAGGAPSISSTLPNAVQDNITRLGTITSIGAALGATFGGTGLSTYILGDTIYGSGVNTLAKLSGNTVATIKYLSQTGTGAVSAAPVWSTISGGDITGAALTKTDDTNVTLTLGGTPTTALLRAASLTLGWTGTLAGGRGGTGVNNGSSTITVGGNFAMSGAFSFTGTLTNTTTVTFPTSGTLATTSQIPTGAALTKTDDTNVTLTLGGSPATSLVNAASITAGWTGTLSGTRGGTGVNNGASTITIGGNFAMSGAFAFTGTLTNTTTVTFPTSGTLATTAQLLTSPLTTKGDIWVWSTTNDRLPVATGDGKILQVSSAASTGLAYSTPTYPSASGSSGKFLISDGTNNGYSTSTIPTSAGATANKHLISDGTNYVLSTPTFPNSASGTGTILRADGTNWVASTSTYPNTNAVSTLLYASSANVMSALATANSAYLTTNSSGVPTWDTSLPINAVAVQIFSATGAFTYTPTTGMKFIKVTMLGAGGGSGAAEGTVAQTAASAPGNGGGYLVLYMTAAQVGASKTGSIGVGGAGGTTPSNTGTAGGNTVFADWTAAGGEGGLGCASAATSQTKQTTGSTANTVGTGTALYNRPTILGFISYTTTTVLANAGASAGNFLGTGGYGALLIAASANTGGAGLLGQGGGGCVTLNTNTDQAGAAGGAGYVSVEEYLSV